MTADEFFFNLQHLKKEIVRREAALRAAREAEAAIHSPQWGIYTGCGIFHASSIEQAAERVEERKEELAGAADAFQTEWNKISKIAPDFSDPLLYCVATYRYFMGYRWEKIGEKMGYSRRALHYFNRKMKQEAAVLLGLDDALNGNE